MFVPHMRLLLRILKYALWEIGGRKHPSPNIKKQSLIIGVSAGFNAKNFVETGTYKGEMAEAMADYFKTLHTIELSKELYNQSKAYLSKHKNINCHYGDSAKVIRRICKKLVGKTVFWLDAHYSGGATARGREDTPIIDELNAITDLCKGEDVMVIIDDARLFNGENGYPTEDRLKEYVSKNFASHILIKLEDLYIIKNKTS